ncbi:MAG: hypothetical protein AAFP76_10080 [Bacteroidota bacterium]
MKQSTSGEKGLLKDKQLFIGLASISNYSNIDINITKFEESIIKDTFREFKLSLKDSLANFNPSESELYEPHNFYAFGFFNLITLSFIDDFHFGNFSYRPYNQYIRKSGAAENSNFQFQVTNCYNLSTEPNMDYTGFLAHVSQRRFVCVCKLKINSSLLIGNGRNTISIIKEIIRNQCKPLDFHIISESFSWHEFTLVLMNDSLSDIITCINNLRAEYVTDHSLVEKGFEASLANERLKDGAEGRILNLFTDSESIYALNRDFFTKERGYLDHYINVISESDKVVNVSTKIQIKTGHAAKLNSLVHTSEFNELFHLPMKIVNGRSDYTIRYKDIPIVNFIEAWRRLIVEEENEMGKEIFDNVRKLHSNVSLLYKDASNGDELNTNTTLHKDLFKDLKFESPQILTIESNLAYLKVSKELANSVLTLFTNFNDIICDINLYVYYIDMKCLLESLEYNINHLAMAGIEEFEDTPVEYYRVQHISEMLLSYINIFENAYGNRFLDSKKNGYNLDIKGEFNGGVHQIIHAYDSAYKIISGTMRKLLKVNNDYNRRFLPIASYGGNTQGIKSAFMDLHLNYFQLFQPEFFLFGAIKESSNYVVDFFRSGDLQPTDEDSLYRYPLYEFYPRIEKYQKNLSICISNEPNIVTKQLLYTYFPPDKLASKIDYILKYFMFFKLVWKDDMETLTFWLWNTFTQDSNTYNLNGSLRIDRFREHFIAFYLVAQYLLDVGEKDFHSELKHIIQKVIRAQDILFYLFDAEIHVYEDCKKIYNILFKGDDSVLFFDEYFGYLESDLDKFLMSHDNVYFSKILDRVQLELREIKEDLLGFNSEDTSGMIMTYMRDSKTGKGIIDKDLVEFKSYTPGVFDPHGGIFIRDVQLRKSLMERRLKIIDFLRDIGYKYKKELYDK